MIEQTNIDERKIADRASSQKGVKALWGEAVTEQSGFVAVPVSLLKSQGALSLSATDMLVLLNLLAHRWTPSTGVFPRNSVIAKRMGVTNRTVQRSMQKLISSGLARRERDDSGQRVLFFSPLVERLTKLTPGTVWRQEVYDDA